MSGKAMEIVVGIAMIITFIAIVSVIANSIWDGKAPEACQCSCRGEVE